MSTLQQDLVTGKKELGMQGMGAVDTEPFGPAFPERVGPPVPEGFVEQKAGEPAPPPAEDATLLPSLRLGGNIPVDRATRVMNVAGKTGFAEEFIDRNLETLEKKVVENDFDPEAFRNQSPEWAEFAAQNPYHASVVMQDKGLLGSLSGYVRKASMAFATGVDTVRLASLGEKAWSGTITPEEREEVKKLRAAMASRTNDFGFSGEGVTGFLGSIPTESVGMLPVLAKGITDAAPIGAAGFVTGAALGGGLATPLASAGLTLGYFKSTAQLEGSLAYLDFEEQGIPRDTAVAAAAVAGVANGALETIAGKVLVNRIPALKRLTTRGIKSMLANPTTSKAITQVLKDVAVTGATEGATEGAQNLVTLMTGKVAKLISSGDPVPSDPIELIRTLAPTYQELSEAAAEVKAGAAGGIGLGGVGNVRTLTKNVQTAKAAKEFKDAIGKAGDAIKQTKIFQSAPETAKKVLAKALDNTAIENVVVRRKEWNAYWQSRGVDPREAAEVVQGTTKFFDDATAGGTDLQVSGVDYLTKVAPTEHNQYFQDHITTPTIDLTEAERVAAIVRGEEEAKVEKARPRNKKEPSPLETALASEAMASGLFTKNQAKELAKVRARQFETLAEDAGVAAEKLYQEFGLEVINTTLGNFEEIQAGKRPLNAAITQGIEVEAEGTTQYYDPGTPAETLWTEIPKAAVIPYTETTKVKALEAQGVKVFTYDPALPNSQVKAKLGASLVVSKIKRFQVTPPKRGDKKGVFSIVGQTQRFVMGLFEKADVSTFIHESAHAYLEMLRTLAERKDATKAVKSRYSETLVALGGQAGGPLTEEMHETFAYGFEKYLLDGVAPAIELKSAFLKFREWLTRAYVLAKETRAEISAELRRVFDRSIATDEEIAESEFENNLLPEFDSERVISVLGPLFTEDQALKYREKINDVRTTAADVLRAKLLKAYSTANRKAVKEFTELATDDVIAELSNDINFTAQTILTRGRYVDGTKVSDLLPGQELKLKSSELAAYFGVEVAKGIDPEFKAKVDASGVPIKTLRRLFGFKSDHEFLLTVASDPTAVYSALEQVRVKLLAVRSELLSKDGPKLNRFAFERYAENSDIIFKLDDAVLTEEGGLSPSEVETKFGVTPELILTKLSTAGRTIKQLETIDEGKRDYARSVFTTGLTPAGVDLKKSIKTLSTLKLNRSELVKRFGEEILEKLPRPHVYSETGYPADMVANILGFMTADELIYSLTNTEPVEVAIKREVDAKVLEQFGDIATNQNEVVEQATRALHNMDRRAILRMELKALVRDDFPTFKGLIKKVTRQLPKEEVLQLEVEAQLSQYTYKELTSIVYLRAANRAAKNAIDLLLKGDIEAAFVEKLSELKNRMLFDRANEMRDEMVKINDLAVSLTDTKTRAKIGKGSVNIRKQIDALLAAYGFVRSDRSRAQMAEDFQEFVAEITAAGESPDFDFTLFTFAKPFKELTFEEAKQLGDTLTQLKHLATREFAYKVGEKVLDFKATKELVISTLTAVTPPREQKTELNPGLKDKVKAALKHIDAYHIRFEHIFEDIGGGANNPVLEALFRPFVDAENAELKLVNEYNEKYRNLIEKYYTKAERADFYTKSYEIPSGFGRIKGTFKKPQILAILLNLGNAENKLALMEGYGLTDETLKQVTDMATEKDWKFVQDVWDLLETLWPAAKKLEEKISGLAPDKVKATKVETPFGKLRGGYYPLKYSSALSLVQDLQNITTDQNQINFTKPMTAKSHLKSRIGSGGKPVELSLSVFGDHVSEVIHDTTHREAVLAVGKLLSDKEVLAALENATNREIVKQLKPWLANIANDKKAEPRSGFEKYITALRMNSTVVSLGINMVSAAVQLTGIAVGAGKVGSAYMLKGLGSFTGGWSKMKAAHEFILANSEMMRNRNETRDRDIREVQRANNFENFNSSLIPLLGNVYSKYEYKFLPEKLRGNFFIFTQIMDTLVSEPVWVAAYNKALDGAESNIERGNHDAAVRFADSVVRQTQSAGAAKDLAGVQRGPQLFKLFTMFYSQLSLMYQAYRRIGNVKSFEEFAAGALWYVFIPAVMESLIRGDLPDGDEPEDYLAWIGGKTVGYPAGSVVGVRDIYRGFESMRTGKYSDVQFSPALASVSGLVRTASDFTDLVFTDEELERKHLRGALKSFGLIAGVPTSQVWKSTEYMYDWLGTGAEQPDNVVAGAYRTLFTGKPRKE